MHTQSATNRWVLVALLWSGGASDCGGSRTQRWEEISLTWISSSLCILFIYSPSGALSPNTSSITYLHLCLSAFRSVSQSIDPGDLQRISCCTEVKKNLCILVLCSFFFFSCISRASLQLLWIQSSKWSAFVPPQASMCQHRLCSNCAHICESRACTGEKSSGWCTQKTLSAVALRQLSCLAGAASSRYHQRQASLHIDPVHRRNAVIEGPVVNTLLEASLLIWPVHRVAVGEVRHERGRKKRETAATATSLDTQLTRKVGKFDHMVTLNCFASL